MSARTKPPRAIKPQCSASVDALNIEGAHETFCCLLRAGHRGAHRFHESLDQPIEGREPA